MAVGIELARAMEPLTFFQMEVFNTQSAIRYKSATQLNTLTYCEKTRYRQRSADLCSARMSSSATPPQETPIWESSIFKEAQLRARTEQAAREAAAVARYKSASNRAPVKVEIDLSSEAGAWKLEHRPYGFLLSRGPGELLIVS